MEIDWSQIIPNLITLSVGGVVTFFISTLRKEIREVRDEVKEVKGELKDLNKRVDLLNEKFHDLDKQVTVIAFIVKPHQGDTFGKLEGK